MVNTANHSLEQDRIALYAKVIVLSSLQNCSYMITEYVMFTRTRRMLLLQAFVSVHTDGRAFPASKSHRISYDCN